MGKFFLILILFLSFISAKSYASNKESIIQNLKNIDNKSFNFEQNINGKKEKGNCILEYPKKIYCKYDIKGQKILVSNGKSLVIKNLGGYYFYPLKKTPLYLILDKNFLINKVIVSKERIAENGLINFNFIENDYEINIFFEEKNFNLIGWQTLDIYQNLSITFLSNITKNKKLKKNIFKLPKQD